MVAKSEPANNVVPPHNREAYESALMLVLLGIPVCRIYSARGDSCGCYKGSKCGTPGKHPVGGFKKHTTDPRELQRWFSETRYNVGIPTGAASKTVAVDFDPRHGGRASLESLLDGRGLESLRTPIARTGGGGFHVLFEHPGGYVTTTTGVMPGVDIRADDGGIVAAGSRNGDGNAYSWLVSPATGKPVPIPDSWLHLFDITRDQPGPRLATFLPSVTQPEESETQRTQRTQETYSPLRPPLGGGDLASLIEQAIEETLPDGPGTRHTKLFEFIRRLKGIPQL